MKRGGLLFLAVIVLGVALQPATAYAEHFCQDVPVFCCPSEGCYVCDTCRFCRIINADGSDGGFMTDC